MVTNRKTRTENISYPPSHSNMLFPSSLRAHTTSESSYTEFNSLNRRSGSLGIGTEILRHVVHFLRRSAGLIEVDGLWSWRACESKTCTKTRLCVSHGWRHADVIFIRQREIHPEWNYFYPNALMRWMRKVNEYNDLQDFVCFYNWFLVVSVHVHETITSYHSPCLSTLEQQTAQTSTSTSDTQQWDVEKFVLW